MSPIPGNGPFYTAVLLGFCCCPGIVYFIVRQIIHWSKDPEWIKEPQGPEGEED